MKIIRNALAALLTCALAIPPANAGGLLGAARSAAARKSAQTAAQTATQTAGERAAIATARPVGKPYDVVIHRSRHPQAAGHIEHAQRHGQPTVLHIDRGNVHARRAASTGGVNSQRRPGPTYERDEYPPALVREGGQGANVRFIERSDNRGAGGAISAQTRALPDGAKIRIVVAD